MPKRGIAALALTAVALVLLLSFKTPDAVPRTRRWRRDLVRAGSGTVSLERRPGDHVRIGTTPTHGRRHARPDRRADGPGRDDRRRARGRQPLRPGPGRGRASAAARSPTSSRSSCRPGAARARSRAPRRRSSARRRCRPRARRSTRSRARPTRATPTRSSLQAALDQAGLDERAPRRAAPPGRARHGHRRQPRPPRRGGPAGRRRRGRSRSCATSTRGSARTAPTARSAGSPAASSTRGDCSPDVRHVLSACDHLALATAAAPSTHVASRPDGGLDPSGFVKGWAVEEAAWLLDDAGAPNYCHQRRRRHRGARGGGTRPPWRVGIRHPGRADRVAAVLAVRDRRRGHLGHLRARRRTSSTRGPAAGARAGQPDGGRARPRVRRRLRDRGLRHGARRSRAGWRAHPDHEALAITDDGRVVWTEGMARYLASAPGAGGRPRLTAGASAGGRRTRAPPLASIGDGDPAAVALDDPVRDREAEPGPAAGRAGCPVEALEDVRHVLRRGCPARRRRP